MLYFGVQKSGLLIIMTYYRLITNRAKLMVLTIH